MNFIDKTISFFNPQAGLKRFAARKNLEMVNNFFGGSGYSQHGASYGKKSLQGWRALGTDADTDIVDSIKTLRARSRDLYMGSPIATGALKTVRTNVIGSGLALSAKIDAAYLGLTEEQALEIKRTIEREWSLWAETHECDAERRLNFYQLQSLVTLSAIMSGDVFVIMPIIKRKGSVYDLRIGLIEADRVCNPDNLLPQDDANILGGVEVGEYGEPIAYWVCNQNPNSAPRNMKQMQKEWKRVYAFGQKTGRRNILHIMADVERPAQRRGVPMLAPVIESLKQLGRYSDAELMAAVISAMFTVFVKVNSPSTTLGNAMGGGMPFGPGFGQEQEAKKDDDLELGNGMINYLEQGEEIQIADPKRPNVAFDGFVSACCRHIGTALEIPYEVLLKNFQSSYSASRAALLEFWKMIRMHREWVISSFCQPIYEEWLTEAVLKGRVQAPGFFDDPAIKAAWCGAEWFGDCQGQLDPLKEVNAAKIRVEEGFSTRSRETAEFTGMKFEDVHEIRKREEAMRKEAGLVPGAVQPAPVPAENGEDENADDGNE